LPAAEFPAAGFFKPFINKKNKMKQKSLGFVLIICGLVLALITRFKFFTRENVVNLGVVQITHYEPHSVNWTPVLGIIIIAVGVILVWKNSGKQSA
jgi:hypothetical protein